MERWTKNSTVLQLVSIQGLVINDQPYFNEPGLEELNKSESWLKMSLVYNEEVFILSCKMMLCHIRKPPKNFKTFVYEHFRERGESILAAIKAYGDGKAIVGQYQGHSQKSSRVNMSADFQNKLKKMCADLQRAFKNLSNSSTPNQVEKKAKQQAKKKNKNNKRKNKESSSSGLMQSIIGFIKNIFE
ncbi:hypothetical protein K7X08_022328 [Anisodus acutangulus]|uniref:Uncharacterized protein n=1 Tax=Anisodus acutangulus TaxID=402998 RepID=A0A9Q1MHR8_9SOLA|nr:hypothetical protein K7X08_022328 [Anisodus acutangulus]